VNLAAVFNHLLKLELLLTRQTWLVFIAITPTISRLFLSSSLNPPYQSEVVVLSEITVLIIIMELNCLLFAKSLIVKELSAPPIPSILTHIELEVMH
jgi:hypothetical protein